ncbi:MAG: exodeoxyribonuclease V subunit gamma [Gammaproteobacteria bacterium]
MPPPLPPGFIALHGNRTEDLLATVATLLERQPLAPLEPEIVLVQSNGMAEWVKMALARQSGICASVNVQLPARFLWQTYRQVLGRAEVPPGSPLDETTLAWRLMRLLPALAGEPGFEPIAGYLAGDAPGRRFQLALHIADLFDQYQVHRPDWLGAWAEGGELLLDAGGAATPLPDDQRWQARLWRRVLGELEPGQRALTRPQVHERALQALAARAPGAGERAEPSGGALPRRVVLFGLTHVPLPTLELLAALSRHSQVLLAIPNPCRFHWADIMDGREWLRSARRRLPLRGGLDLQALDLEEMHLHAHPLLAAWGRQARDFVRQLDAFDDAEQAKARFSLPRIDLFDEDEADDAPLLTQVQNRIRDLVPLHEHPRTTPPAADRSIVFHVAHSPVRELEILHDQLLQLLADPPGGRPLRPRDIVVMVPSIDAFAPSIRAVFGQYDRHDPRHIPFDVADLSARASSPLTSAVQWLLRLPYERCRLSDLCALIDVPAIAARFGIDPDGLPVLTRWMTGAGIRWGLDGEHRAGLSLAACGGQNTALFGLRRMLMGYAAGRAGEAPADAPFADIEPYDEVGGLDAELAGGLARLVERLILWEHDSRTQASPAEWAQRLRALLADLVRPRDDADRDTMAALDDALGAWLDACDEAGFDEPLPLDVAGDAWMSALETPSLGKRFRAGGVTFCTLMPMRAIPFEVVCLLGMNDGDYPRRGVRSDFDLMAQPGQQRPGDRARRDDDRQLMLEALLSARRVLYLSWSGRSVRDNGEQPPSVLVSQLRDYLAAGWSQQTVDERTSEHPLQPFSRRYFEPGTPLFTHAREWRAAHLPVAGESAAICAPFVPDPAVPLTVARLAAFLRNPVKVFFADRLGVRFDDALEAVPDTETFGFDALEEYGLVDELVSAVISHLSARGPENPPADAELSGTVELHLRRLEREGRLPIGGLAAHARARFGSLLLPMLRAWCRARAGHPRQVPRRGLRFDHPATSMEDWLDRLVAGPGEGDAPLWLEVDPARLLEKAKDEDGGKAAADQGKAKKPRKPLLRIHRLVLPWVRALLAAASGIPAGGLLVGRDCLLTIPPMEPGEAHATLSTLVDAWRAGMEAPLPVAIRTALALATEQDPRPVYEGREGDDYTRPEVSDPCLARCHPDFESLSADGRFEELALDLYGPLAAWAQTLAVTPHASAEASAAADAAGGPEA